MPGEVSEDCCFGCPEGEKDGRQGLVASGLCIVRYRRVDREQMELEALECGVSTPRQLALGENRTPGIAPHPGGRLFISQRAGGKWSVDDRLLLRPLCTMEL